MPTLIGMNSLKTWGITIYYLRLCLFILESIVNNIRYTLNSDLRTYVNNIFRIVVLMYTNIPDSFLRRPLTGI